MLAIKVSILSVLRSAGFPWIELWSLFSDVMIFVNVVNNGGEKKILNINIEN